DGLKARLALLGFEADIQVVESGGETWHRVRLGPYDSYRSANSIRNRLQRNEIQTLLMRVRQ
ncbi:MAG: SPOR domain-containing protein, partial [Anaerolineae bacterium]|nr:SPOR domain-containing protein [Anaerolineae bacterium]